MRKHKNQGGAGQGGWSIKKRVLFLSLHVVIHMLVRLLSLYNIYCLSHQLAIGHRILIVQEPIKAKTQDGEAKDNESLRSASHRKIVMRLLNSSHYLQYTRMNFLTMFSIFQ